MYRENLNPLQSWWRGPDNGVLVLIAAVVRVQPGGLLLPSCAFSTIFVVLFPLNVAIPRLECGPLLSYRG